MTSREGRSASHASPAYHSLPGMDTHLSQERKGYDERAAPEPGIREQATTVRMLCQFEYPLFAERKTTMPSNGVFFDAFLTDGVLVGNLKSLLVLPHVWPIPESNDAPHPRFATPTLRWLEPP